MRVLRKVSACRFGLKDRAIAVRQLLSLSCCFLLKKNDVVVGAVVVRLFFQKVQPGET